MSISNIINKLNQASLTDIQLLNIMESIEGAIYVTGSNTELLYMNRAAEELFGFSFKEMQGKKNIDINGNLQYWYPSAFDDVYREKKRFIQEQWSTYSGKKFLTTLVPILDDNQDVIMIVSFSQEQQYSISGAEDNNHDLIKNVNNKILTKSPKMAALLNQVQKIATLDATVLLQGETGTGKNLIAKYIHANSRRSDKPFIMVNCSAIPANILESELFGYAPYTFSGGDPKGKEGLVAAAEGGTIFLDEIGELSLELQPKILGFLQDKSYMKVGGRSEITSNVRVIAATNKDLAKESAAKRFRSDLYYRISVIEFEVPALRDRNEDIRVLSDFFLQKNNQEYSKRKIIAPETYELLESYSWPGNVRQLKNFFERQVLIIDSDIIYPHNISFINENAPETELISNTNINAKPFEITNKIGIDFTENLSLDQELSCLERKLVQQAYNNYKSVRQVAKALDIKPTKAHRLIKQYCGDSIS